MPVTSQFVARIRDYLRTLSAEASGPLLRELDAVVALIRQTPDSDPGLEPLYEAIDDCLDAHFQGERSPNRLTASRALERLLYEVKRVIQQACDVREAERVRYLVPLLKRVAAAGRPFPLVSFNYDTVVETAAAEAGLRIAERVLGEDLADADIELVKVHGSVTWLPGKHGAGLRRDPNFATAVLRRFGELRSATLELPMVYPSRRKMPIYEPFMRNALRLQELLRTRKTCIAVGYSFPDMHVRSWLAEALHARPDLKVYLVDPTPERQALDNLTRNLPTLAWTERLKLIRLRFGDTLRAEGGLEGCMERAEAFGPDLPCYPASRDGFVQTATVCSRLRPAGIGASRDGRALYLSEPKNRGDLLRLDLVTGQTRVLTRKLNAPRGIAVRSDGSVLVVQNRLFGSERIPSGGAGAVVEVSADGARRRLLARFPVLQIAELLLGLARRRPWSTLRERARAILSWPTDVTCTTDGSVYAAEARALVRVRAHTLPERVYKPDLVFNLHGIDTASDGALVAVEQGIGQAFSWGRVARYEVTGNGVRYRESKAADGQSRLMGICFVPPLNKVVVSKMWSWPHGGLLILDYPLLDNPHFLTGFDAPQKLEYVPKRELLAVGTWRGVELISLSELSRATPCLAD